MLHHYCFDKLTNFPLKLWQHLICAFLISYDFDTSRGNLVHVLETHLLVSTVQFECKLQDCLVFSFVTGEWNLLKDVVHQLGVLLWPLVGTQRHVLVLHYSTESGYNIVLGGELTRVGMKLVQQLERAVNMRLEEHLGMLSQNADTVCDISIYFAVLGG